MAKHHTKPKGMGEPGGIQEREATVHLSNLALLDPKTDKPVRVGFRVLARRQQSPCRARDRQSVRELTP